MFSLRGRKREGGEEGRKGGVSTSSSVTYVAAGRWTWMDGRTVGPVPTLHPLPLSSRLSVRDVDTRPPQATTVCPSIRQSSEQMYKSPHCCISRTECSITRTPCRMKPKQVSKRLLHTVQKTMSCTSNDAVKIRRCTQNLPYLMQFFPFSRAYVPQTIIRRR